MKKNKEGICAFCGNPRKLCESHIQPRWLYKDRDTGSGFFLISESDPFRKAAPIGPYEYLLCTACEEHMGKYDTYSAGFFRGADKWQVEAPHGMKIRVVPAYDYKLLKLFMMSVLWRAAAASHPFYSSATLEPPVMELLHQMIEANDPGNEADFSVSISMRTKFHGLERIGGGPKPSTRKEGNRWYRFDLNEFACDIKAGCEPTDFPIEALLKPDPPLLIYEGPVVAERMNEFRQMSLDQQERERKFKEARNAEI